MPDEASDIALRRAGPVDRYGVDWHQPVVTLKEKNRPPLCGLCAVVAILGEPVQRPSRVGTVPTVR